jgi:hypothetical protein
MFQRIAVLPAALALLCWAAPAGAQVIEGETAGEDNLADPRYYGVAFLAGGPAGSFVSSVSFDISADIDGTFDLDGSGNFGGATEPVVQASSLVGLAPGDITWSFSGTQPNVITAHFAPGSFGVGDEFRFACETDQFVADPCPGGSFANGGALFSAQLEAGPGSSTGFAFVNKEVSVATLDFSNCKMNVGMPSRTVEPGGSILVEIDVQHNAEWKAETTVNAMVLDPKGKLMISWQSPEQWLVQGEWFDFDHRFQIPPSAKPGIYRAAVGLGQMRQGIILRTMEFEVLPPPPEQNGGLGQAPVK